MTRLKQTLYLVTTIFNQRVQWQPSFTLKNNCLEGYGPESLVRVNIKV